MKESDMADKKNRTHDSLVKLILLIIKKMGYYTEAEVELIANGFLTREKTELFDYVTEVIYDFIINIAKYNSFSGLTKNAPHILQQLEEYVDKVSLSYLRQFNSLNDLLEQSLINSDDYPVFYNLIIEKCMTKIETFLKD